MGYLSTLATTILIVTSKTYSPLYHPFKKRIISSLSGTILYASILIVVISVPISLTSSAVTLITLVIIDLLILSLAVLVNFPQDYRWNKNYLKAISIGNESIELVVVNQKEEIRVVRTSLENCRIKIPVLVFGSKFRGVFALQIDFKSNGKFETIHKQYEVGEWHLELFKEVYRSYCDFKGVPVSLSAVKRTGI